ncbi:MAG: CheR family methyltransferase, partial [Flavobacteriales bacterium]
MKKKSITPPEPAHEAMLTLTEAAAMLRSHPNTIRAWVRQGKLTPIAMGSEKVGMFRKRDVEALVQPLQQAGVIVQDDKQAFPVVGIGASAGGLEAVSRLLNDLPTDLGLAYVFVTHLESGQEPVLADLLRKRTAMPVMVVENGMKLERDRLYVGPGAVHVSIVDSTFMLQGAHGKRDTVPQAIDAFFIALADEYQNNAIGVLLSGTGADGTEGLHAIRVEGGLAIVQDASAQNQAMPRNAQEAGVVDLVLRPEDVGKELADIVKQLYPAGQANIPSKHQNELRRILSYLEEKRGVDFSQYKESTIHRRIIRRMVLSKCRKLGDYSALLRGIPTEVDTLYNDLLINVSSFFRDPQFFKSLTEYVFPAIFLDRTVNEPVRIWVPACAGGEEVISIAITLLEFLGDHAMTTPVQIFSTDLNEHTIEKARLGIYKKSALQNISPARIKQFFTHVDGHFQVIKSVRDLCVFAKHDLLKDPPFSRIDLISCQNVLIYMENAAQGRILKSFHYALKPTGFLALGKSETAANSPDLFLQPERDHKIYTRKNKGPARLNLDVKYQPAPLSMVGGVVPQLAQATTGASDLDRDTDKLLLNRYVPASVLVNKDLDIVRFRGATAPYLAPSTGKASLNLLKMVRDDLALELRALLQKARKEKMPARKSGVPVRMNEGMRDVGLEVVPIGELRDPHYLVLFKEEGLSAMPASGPPDGRKWKNVRDARERRIILLEQELRDLREQMRVAVEDSEANNQELQAANEEVVSSNEELQSINEELETSKEELQSINEEFATINEELQSRNDALRESEDRLRLATRTGKVGIWDWDIATDHITWSDSLFEIHGVTPGTFDTSVKGFANLIHPADRERVEQAMDRTLKLDERYAIEFRAVRPDGRVIWLFTNASVIRSTGRPIRMLGASVDITELKATESSLQQRTQSLELLNGVSDTLIAELDTEKIVQAVTDAGREVTGAAFG